MELSDIMFFVNTVKYPSPNFNILYYYYQVIFILIDYPDYGTLFPQLIPPPPQLNLNSFGLAFYCISNQIILVLFISFVRVQNANLLVLIFCIRS